MHERNGLTFMKKLSKEIEGPWRITCIECGSYELYEIDDKVHCDKCSHNNVLVYDKKQSKQVHYETLL